MNNLETQITNLLDQLCTDLGFCLPPDEIKKIASSKSISADKFTRQVLTAEGMYPEYEKKWFSQIKEKFADKFGDSVSECE